MQLLIISAILVALIVWYAVQGRDWLKSKPWAAGFFAWIEPIEIRLFKKSQTILFARLKIVSGLILTMLTQAGTINLTPLMPFVPDQYQAYVNVAVNCMPLALSLMGWIDEALRNKTTAPLALVALSDQAVADSPKLAEAVAMADQTKTEAVAAVVEAKAA
jgi:hypothetical protein